MSPDPIELGFEPFPLAELTTDRDGFKRSIATKLAYSIGKDPMTASRYDWYCALCLVLRDRLQRADPEEARYAILGITCACDVTARDLQRRDPTFARAKSFDTFCPLGPAIQVDPDLEDVEVVTRINGEERQRGHSSRMLFGILDLLSYASRMMTLEPGDLFLTGTPEGVGPLADGDRLEVEVSSVGVLENPVEAWTRQHGLC